MPQVLKQAGMDVEDITMTTQGPEKPASQREAETCDIVVVGGVNKLAEDQNVRLEAGVSQ